MTNVYELIETLCEGWEKGKTFTPQMVKEAFLSMTPSDMIDMLIKAGYARPSR